MKKIALYALALHHDNDPVRAKQLLDELESHREDYLMPGEYLTAIYLIGQCDSYLPENCSSMLNLRYINC